uniref:Zinc finger and BTB domain containing 40 n=1 Tax=Neogobius melanostomus TaxID=47308 RepID=A0A8C6UVY5_9GOBI
MVYTGKLPLGKHNVLSTIVNPQPSPSEDAAQVLSQDEIKNDSTDTTTTTQELPLKKNESVRETSSPNENPALIKKKKQKKQDQSSDNDCSDEPVPKTTAQRVASVPHETLKKNSDKQAACNERPNATELKALKHSSVIIEALNKLPAIRDLLRQAAEYSLDQQDRQVVITCCDKVDPDKVGEMLLSHVEKGVLSEMALISLLSAVHKNNPTTTTPLQSVLQELETDIAGANQLKDSTRNSNEAEDTDEEANTKGGKGTEEKESMTDDSDDYEAKKEASNPLSKMHACRTCEKTFAFKCRLRAHTKRCSKSPTRSLHKCPQCPEKLPSNCALMHHKLRAHRDKVECELCGRKFAHPSGLIYHMRSEHFEEKPFTCKECGAKFAAKSSLKNHVRLHTGEKPYVCKDCDMCFTVAAGLAYHIKKKHSQGNMYTCQYCKAEFAQSIELTRHVRTHTGDRPYVCRECGKGYSQASQLTAHLESAHATSETYDCQKCSLSFSSRIEHNNHIQKLHPDEFHKCPACEKVFPNASSLNKHKSTHKGVKLFNCDLCNKSYQQLSGLWYHNRTQHAEVFNNPTRQLKALVQCDICFKFFPSEETLAQHQAIEHQGSLGFSLRCPLCPAVFAEKDWMQEHIISHHAEQRETVCRHCFVLCGSASELLDHMLTQHPKEEQDQQQETSARVSAEAPEETVDDAEQVRVTEHLLQAVPYRAADFVLSETQAIWRMPSRCLWPWLMDKRVLRWWRCLIC